MNKKYFLVFISIPFLFFFEAFSENEEETYTKAKQIELIDADYDASSKLYRRILEKSQNEDLVSKCLNSLWVCYQKLDRKDEDCM